MGNLRLDNTNSFGAAGYVMNWVSSPKSTFGGVFKDEVSLLESGLMDFRYVQIGDIKEAYTILDKKLSNSKNIDFEDVMRYVAETVQEYFGNYSNISSRLDNYPDEDEVSYFSLERGKASNLKGKNAAMCVERAMLSQNLLKYASEKLPGLNSYFKETGIEIQRDGDKPKREVHAFNLVSYNGKYYIFDSTIPKGTKDNLQPIVAELPEHVFKTLVESSRIGYAVEMEHVSALTEKKVHYTLDYRAEEKFKVNEELVNNERRNKFIESLKVSPKDLLKNHEKQTNKVNEELVNNERRNKFIESLKVSPENLLKNHENQTNNENTIGKDEDGPSLDD